MKRNTTPPTPTGVLVIDHDYRRARLVADTLTVPGHLAWAAAPDSALAAFQHLRPELSAVLLAFDPDETDDLGVLLDIRSQAPELGYFLLVADLDPVTATLVRRATSLDVLPNPPEIADVVRALSGRESESQLSRLS